MISFDKEKTRNLWFDNVKRIYASTLSETSHIDVTLPEDNRPVPSIEHDSAREAVLVISFLQGFTFPKGPATFHVETLRYGTYMRMGM